MDALTDVIRMCRLSGTVFSRAWLDAPWGVKAPELTHGIFHAVIEGACWVTPDGGEPTSLEQGDIVFLPHGTPHIMSHEPMDDAPSIFGMSKPSEDGGPASLVIEGGGVRTELICGRVNFEEFDSGPLLEVLPDALICRPSPERAEMRRQTLAMIRDELAANAPGAEVMVGRLTEVLMVEALRDWLKHTDEEIGWLSGLTDRQIARALGHIHREPDKSWTVEDLARIAGMSRSGFSARFNELVGDSPHSYLTRWRMHLASRALLKEQVTLAEIASRVGYASEFSFSKAFKNAVGMSPTEFRASSDP